MHEGERLIQRLDHSRDVMRRALSSVDGKMEIYPGWTIREILIHIAGWDEVGANMLLAHLAGTPLPPLEVQGIDAYNDYLVERCDSFTHEEVIQYWRRARRQLVDALEEMPPEKFLERADFPWGETGSIVRLVSILEEHEREHAAEILEMLSPQADEEED